MVSNENTELITLEVLGCLNNVDREKLRMIKDTDENFPWKELANYQNLAAQLPSALTENDIPSTAAKGKLLSKLNNLLVVLEEKHDPERFTFGAIQPHSVDEGLHKVLERNKVDWGSIAAETDHENADGFKEVKSKAAAINRDFKFDEKGIFKSNENELNNLSDNKSESLGETDLKTSSKVKKYILAAAVLFMISVSLFAYIMLRNDSGSTEPVIKPENNLSGTKQLPAEEFLYNGLDEFKNIKEETPVQNVESTTKKETEKIVLPKAPPKLPDPIEAPLNEVAEVNSEETPKVEEQPAMPPPKEVINITEEPTYFVAVEEMPQPIGGLPAIQSKIVYPEIAKRAGIEGKVFVRAYVDESGNVVNAEIVKGIGGGCDEAALNAILSSKFTPGKQRGKPIKVQVTVPVVFKL